MIRTKALAALVFALATGSAAAQSAADYYRDRQLRLLVGSAAGSGYDLNARLLARHLANHLPGKPNIIVQNLVGAGSVVMANQLYNTAPKDGSVLAGAINGMPTAALFTPDKVKFDPNKFLWIGSSNRDTQVTYVWHTTPVHKLSDLMTHEILAGATTPGTTQVDYPLVARALFGLKYKVISGYKGTADIHSAMESGEVQAMGSNGWISLKALKSDWIRDKKIRIIVQFNFVRNPELKDVPTIFEMAKTEADKQALALMVARLEYGRPFFFPPGVPADRVDFMRRAFDATMKDAEFLGEAKRAKLDVDPLTGEKVAEIIAQVMRTPKDVVARVSKALSPGGK